MAGCFRGKRGDGADWMKNSEVLRVQTIELEMEEPKVIKSDGPGQAMEMPFTEMGRLQEKRSGLRKQGSYGDFHGVPCAPR